MERPDQLCTDPEDSEIFFYDVTEKEIHVRNKLKLETNKNNSEETNNDIRRNADETIKSEHELDVIETDFSEVDSCNVLSFALSKDQKKFGSAAEISVAGSTDAGIQPQIQSEENGKRLEIIQPQNIQTTPEKKSRGKNCVTTQNAINLYTDNNSSNSLKNVIDRSILETSKGVVKADKDGGFLKVLSEIALIKAEADENAFRDTITSYDIQCEEKLGDDNKENKNNDHDMVNAINVITDMPLTKVQHVAPMEKLNDDIQAKRNDYIPPEKLNMKELDSGYEKKFQNGHSKTIKDNYGNEVSEIMTVSLAKDKIIDSNKLELNDNVFKEEGNLGVVTNNETELLQTHNSQNKNFNEGTTLEGNIIFDNNHDINKVTAQKITESSPPELILSVNSSEIKTEEQKECSVSVTNEKEANRKLLKRNTILLLEELNELVISDQKRKESLDCRNYTKLSEEATKVIQKLKTIGMDDSICLSDQCFDIDKLNGSFFPTEMTDILNDTLSKPLNSLTPADIELLLEKISLNPLEGKEELTKSSSANTNVLNKLKENENLDNLNKGSDLQAVKLVNPTLVSPCKALNCEKSIQSSSKVTVKQNSTSQDKKSTPKSGIKSQANYFLSKGNFKCQSSEKNVKPNYLTRIPKLTSTTSKVPISAKEMETQIKKPLLIQTPLHNTQKRLRFNNIESPVRAYINSKVPVSKSASCVKSKPEPSTNYRTLSGKSTESKNQDMKKVLRKNDALLNLPSAKSRNVFPSKLKKSPESRLPKFTPRAQKAPLMKKQ